MWSFIVISMGHAPPNVQSQSVVGAYDMCCGAHNKHLPKDSLDS